MWDPKHLRFKELAQEIADKYSESPSKERILELSKEYGLHITSIYRYLKLAGVILPARKRSPQGKFI